MNSRVANHEIRIRGPSSAGTDGAQDSPMFNVRVVGLTARGDLSSNQSIP